MRLSLFLFLSAMSIIRGCVAIMAAILVIVATKAQAEIYVLAAGDRLRIEIVENQQVGGEFPVEADGTVSIPGIGVLTASGLGLREFEENLRNAASVTISNPSVSVQITEYRPFFILGDVDAAGKYPYTPDLDVMKAVAIAGGFGRKVTGDEISRALAVNQARKSLTEGRIDLASAKVNLARLKAEKAMHKTFEYTPDAEDDALGERMATTVQDAQTLFDTRQNAYLTRLEKLENTKAARLQEAESFEKQIALQRARLETSQAELSEIQDARDQGIVSAARLNAVIQSEQSVRAQALQIETLKRQSEVSRVEVERQIADLVVARNLEIDREIQTLTEKIGRLKARARADQVLLAEAGAGPRTTSGNDRRFRFELYRNGDEVTVPVDLSSPIKPGDTLFVILDVDN